MSNYDISHLTQPKDQWVIGPIQDDEALFLYSIIRGKRIKNVFEIGGLQGYSAKNFLAAVGPAGKVYTVDINPVTAQAENHCCIQKNAMDITATDLDNCEIGLIFFDCHNYGVQMMVYDNLRQLGLINDNTVIALHDTNLHYPSNRPLNYGVISVTDSSGQVAYIHQPVERRMVNTFVDMGYHAFSLHTRAEDHDETMPNRHGVTVMMKWSPLLV
jgi:hypothetical protein